jgi:PTS system nitrogen regulatory IIA component
MIDITSYLHPDRILCRHASSSKKKALETMSELLAHPLQEDARQTIFEALLKRERLGSTGLGTGIALPHGRIDALQSPLAAVATLQSGVDFDAADGLPVDILFALAMPENCNDQHLQILAGLAEMFSDPNFRNALRNAKSSTEIHALLVDWRGHAESA